MNLFNKFRNPFKKQEVENGLFNLNFIVRKSIGKNKIDLEFTTKPNQEELIAEFIFRIKHDEKLWQTFYDTLTKELSPESVELIESHLKDLYARFILGAAQSAEVNATEAQKQANDDPVISPLKG